MSLHSLFACDKRLFFEFAVNDGWALKYGSDSLEDLWFKNPIITFA